MPLQAASTIVTRPLSWLWPGRIPCGYLTMLDGDPGLGKSFLALDVAARVSVGRAWPDGKEAAAAGATIYLSGEDGPDVVVPRLRALGADLSRVFLWPREPGEPWPSLPGRAELLERAIEAAGARFVVLDPVFAFIDPAMAAASDLYVRAALAPLCAMAQKHECAILMVRHLRKKGAASAVYRGAASIAFSALCRSTLLVGRDPATPRQSVLASVKNNVDGLAASLVFVVERDPLTPAPLPRSGGEGDRVAPGGGEGGDVEAAGALGRRASAAREEGSPSLARRAHEDDEGHPLLARRAHEAERVHEGPDDEGRPLRWLGVSSLTAADLLAPDALQETRARVFLEQALAAGPRAVKEVRAAAAKQSISKRTLSRAAKQLEVKTHRWRPFSRAQVAYWLLRDQEVPEEWKDPEDADLEKYLAPLRNYVPAPDPVAAAGID